MKSILLIILLSSYTLSAKIVSCKGFDLEQVYGDNGEYISRVNDEVKLITNLSFTQTLFLGSVDPSKSKMKIEVQKNDKKVKNIQLEEGEMLVVTESSNDHLFLVVEKKEKKKYYLKKYVLNLSSGDLNSETIYEYDKKTHKYEISSVRGKSSNDNSKHLIYFHKFYDNFSSTQVISFDQNYSITGDKEFFINSINNEFVITTKAENPRSLIQYKYLKENEIDVKETGSFFINGLYYSDSGNINVLAVNNMGLGNMEFLSGPILENETLMKTNLEINDTFVSNFKVKFINDKFYIASLSNEKIPLTINSVSKKLITTIIDLNGKTSNSNYVHAIDKKYKDKTGSRASNLIINDIVLANDNVFVLMQSHKAYIKKEEFGGMVRETPYSSVKEFLLLQFDKSFNFLELNGLKGIESEIASVAGIDRPFFFIDQDFPSPNLAKMHLMNDIVEVVYFGKKKIKFAQYNANTMEKIDHDCICPIPKLDMFSRENELVFGIHSLSNNQIILSTFKMNGRNIKSGYSILTRN